jgi:hypothetical protein
MEAYYRSIVNRYYHLDHELCKDRMGFRFLEKKCLSARHLETAIEASEAFEVDYSGAGAIENLNAYH